MQKLKFNSSKEIPALYVNHTDILHVLLNNHGGVILHRFLIMYNISGGGSHAPQAAVVLSVVLYKDANLDQFYKIVLS